MILLLHHIATAILLSDCRHYASHIRITLPPRRRHIAAVTLMHAGVGRPRHITRFTPLIRQLPAYAIATYAIRVRYLRHTPTLSRRHIYATYCF